jgi:predicted metal-dependent hydrolase
MRNIALKLIKENTKRLADKFNLKYKSVSVKNQSSRFGSCSHSGSLNFNWQIILFPVPIFEHIILHELTHLIVKNHSKMFWELLGSYDKNWRENNQWLKKEGTKKFIV